MALLWMGLLYVRDSDVNALSLRPACRANGLRVLGIAGTS